MYIVCPHCGLEKEFPDAQIPADAEMATCPRCKHKFQFRSLKTEPSPQPEQFIDAAEENQPRQSAPQEEFQNTGIPFESPDKYELIPGLLVTIREVLLESPKFFSRMPLNAGYARPILFYLIISMGQLLIRLLEVKYLGSEDLFLGDSNYFGGQGNMAQAVSWRMISFTLAISPIMFLFALAVYSALAHLFLSVFQAANSGFQATFRVMAYGSAPSILAIIPVAGPAVSLLWSLAAIFIGLRYAHRTSFPKVGLSMLALVILALGVVSYLMNVATTSLPAGSSVLP